MDRYEISCKCNKAIHQDVRPRRANMVAFPEVHWQPGHVPLMASVRFHGGSSWQM
jgi:hypothetical protein